MKKILTAILILTASFASAQNVIPDSSYSAAKIDAMFFKVNSLITVLQNSSSQQQTIINQHTATIVQLQDKANQQALLIQAIKPVYFDTTDFSIPLDTLRLKKRITIIK